MERYGLISRRTSAARSRFLRFVAFFIFVSMLTQASVFAPGSVEPIPPTPPVEKLLCQFGQWETEYWSDNGVLAFQYVGDPNPVPKLTGHVLQADFSISKTTLLTAIISVHFNPDVNATHVENTSPGNLSLVDDVGNYYGPFPAEVTSAINNDQASATVLWVASVDHVELPPGHYLVIEWDTSSVLYNAETQGVPATIVKGIDAEAYANYMDALIAANEPEPIGPAKPDNSGTIPPKVTYSKPLQVVNNPPNPISTTYPANNPSFSCKFVTDKPVMVMKIVDYHINNGKGATPSMIGLQEHGGTWYGSWHAYGQAVNKIPNSKWVVTPNFEIPAGSYEVRDNENSTLSADSNNRAMCEVNISPVVTNSIDNVTGKYSINFSGDDGTALDFPLVLAIIDHKKTLEIGTIVVDQPFKFVATVTDRSNGIVKAEYRQGWGDLKFVLLLNFKKSADKFVLTGRINFNAMGESAGINLAGSRTSTDLPGFIPNPPAGIGKVGSIPGPANTGQAVAGIAFPTIATLIAAAAASAGGGGGGGHHHSSGGGGEGDYSGDSGEVSGTESSGDGGDTDYGNEGDDYGSSGGGSGDTAGTYDSVSENPPEIATPPIPFDEPPSLNVPPALDEHPLPKLEQAPITGITGDTKLEQGNIPVVDGIHGDTKLEQGTPPAMDTFVEPPVGTGVSAGTGTGTDTGSLPPTLPNKDAVSSQTSTATQAGTATGVGTTVIASGAAAAGGSGSTGGIPASAQRIKPGGNPESIYGPDSEVAGGAVPLNQKDPVNKPDPVLSPIQKGLINLNNNLNNIDKKMRDENVYVANKAQGVPVVETVVYYGNKAWDNTIGQFTGSQGVTCQDYVAKTDAAVREAVEKEFPGAKVDRIDFDEQSTLRTEAGQGSWGDWLDAKNKQNHTYHRITLPDKSQWSVDFHGGNASLTGDNPPILRPNSETKQIWTDRLGADEIFESANVNLNIKSPK